MLERSDQGRLKRFAGLIRDIPAFAILSRELPREVIPSFIFHKVLPEDFEEILDYLKENHYRTLTIREYEEYLTGKRRDSDKKVLLTFDDGLRNNWSVAYPLLKKFGMNAVFYVNPGMIHDEEDLGPSIEDVWARKVSEKEFEAFEARSPFVTWSQARQMDASGIAHIECHGWRHRICFVEDKIIDFQRPDKEGNPVYSWLFTAVDAEARDPLWGMPVYPYKPRLVARRFFDDAGLRDACIRYAAANGGKEFFLRKNWRSLLQEFVGEYRKGHSLSVRFENPDEQELSIRDSIVHSKKMIEEKLGKKCEHFAYPWNVGGRLSLLWLKELEFKTVFRAMSGWRLPRVGCDPHNLSRVEGYWIKGLPGKGRMDAWRKLARRILGTRHKLS